MDFSKQLANLRHSASRAQQQGRTGRREGTHDDRDHQSDDFNRGRDHGNGSGRGRGRYSNSRYRREPYSRNNRNHRQQMSEAEEEFYFPKLIQAIPNYKPLPPKKKQKQRHVCLLFLTIDDLPLEHLWKAFLSTKQTIASDSKIPGENGSDLMISVVCHAKFPEKVKSAWLKKRILVHKPPLRDLQQYKERYGNNSHIINDSCLPPTRYFSRKPEWGSVEITRAMIDLLEEGLKMGTNRDSTVSNVKNIKDPRQAEEYRSRYSSYRYISTKHAENIMRRDPIPTVDRFIFVSETCMPVTNMEEFECALFCDEDDMNNSQTSSSATAINGKPAYDSTGANKSWINARNTPNNGYARQLQWDVTDSAIPRSKIWKADQWIVLTRHHAWPILSLIDDAVQSIQNDTNRGNDREGGHRSKLQLALWQCFRRVKASDEIYFPTVMALLGILRDTNDNEKDSNVGKIPAASTATTTQQNDEISIRRVTYCDWSMNAKNPASFQMCRADKFKEVIRVIKLARAEKCLFARKFKDGDITEEEWLSCIQKLRKAM